jgi:hypothetical protein
MTCAHFERSGSALNMAFLLKEKYALFFFENMGKHADSKILRRIQSLSRGWVFTPDSFTDLGTPTARAISTSKIACDKNAINDCKLA